MIIFSSLLITTYTIYAPSLLHAVIEAKAEVLSDAYPHQ